MQILKCAGCGRPAFPVTPSLANKKKWLCSACLKKVEQIDFKTESAKPDYCQKCRKRTAGSCPFTARERKKIVKCNHWIGKDTERDKRRFAKFENYE